MVAWFSNAAANAQHYVHKSAWGAVPIGRTVRVMLHRDVAVVWEGIGWERALSVALGLVGLLWGLGSRLEFRRILGLVATVLLIPGNMHFYTGLYLAPVCLLWMLAPRGSGLRRAVEAVCWFLVFNPLQIPYGVGCLNHPIANLAFLCLLGGVEIPLSYRLGFMSSNK